LQASFPRTGTTTEGRRPWKKKLKKMIEKQRQDGVSGDSLMGNEIYAQSMSRRAESMPEILVKSQFSVQRCIFSEERIGKLLD
jgi:hypothetical protein